MRNDLAVNLLPNGLKAKRQFQKSLNKTIFTIIIVMLVFVALNIILASVEYSYTLTQNSLNESIAQVEQKISAMDKSQKQAKVLNYKNEISKTLDTTTANPEKILKEIAGTIPQNLSLTAIDIDLNSKTPLNLAGTAPDRRDIIVFTEALNANATFTDAQINTVTNSTKADVVGVTFTITLKLKGIK